MSPADPSLDAPILRTKLFAPSPPRQLVPREPLLDALQDAPGLVVVSAPAGFGKSTLVASWLRQTGVPFAWLSLEEADNTPRRFLTYLAAALGELPGDLDATLRPWLRSPQLPPVEVLLNPLLNALSQGEDEAVLVLDDLHTLHDTTVHGWLRHLIEHLPIGFRLVLSSRTEPPFSIARWRGRGRVREVGASDLRFSAGETHRFLADIMGLPLTHHASRELHQCTEGWAAGLQMAALSLGHPSQVDGLVEAFRGGHRHVLEYLSDEVLARQDDALLDFLLRVSILERFQAPLCDALMDHPDGADMLQRLEAENLFLIPLDAQRRWFRFHHLFRQLLEAQRRQRLGDATERQLHQRASDWFLHHDLPDEALNHALAADDRERSLDVLKRFAESTLEQGDAATVLDWFECVPLEWVEATPGLPIQRALALYLSVHWQALQEWAPRLREVLKRQSDARPGHLQALETWLATAGADRETVLQAGPMAMEQLPEEEYLLRSVLAITLGSALMTEGRYDEARDVFKLQGGTSPKPDHLGLDATRTYFVGRILLVQGHLDRAHRHHVDQWQRLAGDGLPHPLASLSLIGQAESSYEWGRLEEARGLVQQAMAVDRGCFPLNALRAQVLLLDIERSRRDLDASLGAAEVMLQMMQHIAIGPWEGQIAVQRMRTLALMATSRNDAEAEAAWQQWGLASGIAEVDDLGSLLQLEEPKEVVITLGIRWLLHRGQGELARKHCVELRGFAQTYAWRRVLIESWLLESQALLSTSSSAAVEALRRALTLAAESGHVQVVADEREWLQSLPESLWNQASIDVPSAFLQTLVQDVQPTTSSNPASSTPPASIEGGAGEVLSQRELEVLQAVAAGGTNADVGDQLCISPRTVKKHLENIYGKLDVHGRVEAIHRARKLGLLNLESSADDASTQKILLT